MRARIAHSMLLPTSLEHTHHGSEETNGNPNAHATRLHGATHPALVSLQHGLLDYQQHA